MRTSFGARILVLVVLVIAVMLFSAGQSFAAESSDIIGCQVTVYPGGASYDPNTGDITVTTPGFGVDWSSCLERTLGPLK